MPLARLTAVGLVAAVATLTAVQFGPAGSSSATTSTSTPAPGTDVHMITPGGLIETSGTNAQAATAEANKLISESNLPPGSVRLASQPNDAPNHGQPPFQQDVPTKVTRTAWWSSTLSPAAALAWMGAHPASGLEASGSGTTGTIPDGFISFQGNGGGVLNQITVDVVPFTLPDGKTGIQVSAVVVYLPERSAAETIPAAAKLVAIPEIVGSGERGSTSVTFTVPGKIDRVARIINALPTQTLGTFSCPVDYGAALVLDFESGSGAVLAQVMIKAGGCGGVFVTADGQRQPELAGGAATIQQIQDVLGTHWPLSFTGH